jgi:hypothetical protein
MVATESRGGWKPGADFQKKNIPELLAESKSE